MAKEEEPTKTRSARWMFTPEEIDIVVAHMNNVFLLLYERVPNFTDADWDAGFKEYADGLRDHVLRQIRGLANACEARGISSTPLAFVGTKWATLWRRHPAPREAFAHLEELIPSEWLVEQLAATTQRLQRFADIERRPKVESGDGAGTSGRGQATPRGSKKPQKVSGRRRPTPPPDWIYAADATKKYGVPRTTLQDLFTKLGPGEKVRDEDINQVRVQEDKLREILRKRGMLSD